MMAKQATVDSGYGFRCSLLDESYSYASAMESWKRSDLRYTLWYGIRVKLWTR